jgi:hypothetical protein
MREVESKAELDSERPEDGDVGTGDVIGAELGAPCGDSAKRPLERGLAVQVASQRRGSGAGR